MNFAAEAGYRERCLTSNTRTKFSCSKILWAARTLDKVYDFHVRLGIPTKRRSIRKDDAWYSLYCFADSDHAKLFRVMFGGELTQAQSKV